MITDKSSSHHYTWGGNCDCWVLHDTESFSVKQEIMPPGSREKLHLHHHTSQFFYILKGSAAFYLDDNKLNIGEGQGLTVSPGTKHFIANESKVDIEFLIITQPSGNDREDVE